jgi:hypothetical protein
MRLISLGDIHVALSSKIVLTIYPYRALVLLHDPSNTLFIGILESQFDVPYVVSC